MSGVGYLDIYEAWSNAQAFVVNNRVCGNFSVPSPDDLADAEAAEGEGQCPDFEPCAAFYIYGEQGFRREYYVSRTMIEHGERYEDGFCVTHDGDHEITIEPLYSDTGRLRVKCRRLEAGLQAVSDEAHGADPRYVPNIVLGIVHRTLKEANGLTRQ